ncbi:hypothetical protein HHI36_010208 [Cryptolaemus montrouzieri]|uniref:Uncharacterized protein n=1 Tax=Cryptolaemus montrouzieri TaxID=559131 RepID=A0ABD2MI28_9CUCU
MRLSTSNIHTTEIDDPVSIGNEDQELDRGSEKNGTRETPVSLNMPPPPPQKRKVSSTAKHTSHSDVDKVIHYLHNKTAKREYDGIDHLFLSYDERFRKFQPATQAMLKMKLATIFAGTEMRVLQAHNQRPVLSTPQPLLHSDIREYVPNLPELELHSLMFSQFFVSKCS